MSIEILKNKKTYIAGPMSGYPQFNYPAFYEMERELKTLGVKTVLNPVYIGDGDTSLPYDFYIRHSMKMISDAEAIVMLDGWEKSKGAQLEYHVATLMGIPVFNQKLELQEGFKKTEEKSIYDEALELIHGDRQKQYGSPRDNFTMIGGMWAALLELETIAPETVALMMALLKIAREKSNHKRDNNVDGVAYIGIAQGLKDGTF